MVGNAGEQRGYERALRCNDRGTDRSRLLRTAGEDESRKPRVPVTDRYLIGWNAEALGRDLRLDRCGCDAQLARRNFNFDVTCASSNGVLESRPMRRARPVHAKSPFPHDRCPATLTGP